MQNISYVKDADPKIKLIDVRVFEATSEAIKSCHGFEKQDDDCTGRGDGHGYSKFIEPLKCACRIPWFVQINLLKDVVSGFFTVQAIKHLQYLKPSLNQPLMVM